MSVLDELASVISSAADKVGPSVVSVNRSGSGIVVGKDRVATNAHNLRGHGIMVGFADGRLAEATPLGVDVDGDLVVLSVPTGDAPAVEWADETPGLGTPVVALANPRGRGLRATFGTVSSVNRAFRGPRGRRIAGSLEHTAPLARGSSGGPVLGTDGRLVGINTHRLQEGLYLALAVGDDLKRRIEALSAGEAPTRRRLGVAIVPEPAASRVREAAGLEPIDGLLVRGVEEGGPADGAGLRRGDVVTAVGGRSVASVDDLFEALDTDASELEVTVVRGNETLQLTVRFEAAPKGDAEE